VIVPDNGSTMDASPAMNMKSQNNRMLRPTLLRHCGVSLALLSAAVSAAPALAQGTRAQRMACTSDALRLCSAFIPDADAITACLRDKNAELGDACRSAFEAMNQLPGVGAGTTTRKPENVGR
jgi:hypothetical protein